MSACIDNYINANLSDAINQARRLNRVKLYLDLRENYHKTHHQAWAIVDYLKNPGPQTWKACCDAQYPT